LSLPDDSDTKWQLKEHSIRKLEIFKKYLGAFIPITGRYWNDVFHVNAFAGRGRYIRGELKISSGFLFNAFFNCSIK